MAMEYTLLKKGPMSSHWSFVGEYGGKTHWRSRNGKLVAKDADGNWYRVTSSKDGQSCR